MLVTFSLTGITAEIDAQKAAIAEAKEKLKTKALDKKRVDKLVVGKSISENNGKKLHTM